MLKSRFRTYPYNTQFGCTSNYFALVSAHSGDFLKVSVGWDVAGRNTSIQVVYESYFRWEAVGQRGESQETQEIQGRVSWSENLCLTCDFFVSFRTSEEQGVTSFVWQIKSYQESQDYLILNIHLKNWVSFFFSNEWIKERHDLLH